MNQIHQNHKVVLVGCPKLDYVDLPALLENAGMAVRAPELLRDQDKVVFCISCAQGPTEGTRAAVAQCAGRTFQPIAIVMTQDEIVDCPSIRELVKCEMWDLLSTIMPKGHAEMLPFYYSSDPNLGERIRYHLEPAPIDLESAKAKNQLITINEATRL